MVFYKKEKKHNFKFELENTLSILFLELLPYE